jgi:hypothetical protein
VSRHRADRPTWQCSTCGDHWPCEFACKLLADAYQGSYHGSCQRSYQGDRIGLTRHLAQLMAVAAEDLGLADPTRLYRRFLGWTLDPDQRCRVCDRQGHDVLAGVPPRLIPCRQLRDAVRPPR